MKLANRFNEEDKIRYWVDHQYCAICKSNQNCSLHHICGTESASIYNSIMLCYRHHREADSHNTNSPLSLAFRKNLLNYTFRRVDKEGKVRTVEDEGFLKKYLFN